MCHKQHSQIIKPPSPSYSHLYQFIQSHLYSTVPFPIAPHSFSLSQYIQSTPPQTHTPLTFIKDLVALQDHIDEHLKLQIIEVGQAGNWIHQLLSVQHFNQNKEKDGIRWVANLIKINKLFLKMAASFLLIQ